MDKKYILRSATTHRRSGTEVYIGESGKDQAERVAKKLTESDKTAEPLEVVELIQG